MIAGKAQPAKAGIVPMSAILERCLTINITE